MWFVKHKVWSQTDLYRQKDDAHCLFAFFFDCLISSYDCSNPIYGQTVNPHNFQKTSGGSSGGEGALIGGGGSLLGIGSDIGGSIRIPASFCGICGFKPTSGRLRWEFLFQSGLWMICDTLHCISTVKCFDFFVFWSVHRVTAPFIEGKNQVSYSCIIFIMSTACVVKNRGHFFVCFF